MSIDTEESSTLALGEINKYDFRTDTPSIFKARRGLDRDIVSQISEMKKEPAWMRDFRLKSLDIFNSKPMPHWGGNIGIDFQDIFYYLKPAEQQGKTWEEVPEEIKKTFDRLGIPEAERKFLSGVKAQFEDRQCGEASSTTHNISWWPSQTLNARNWKSPLVHQECQAHLHWRLGQMVEICLVLVWVTTLHTWTSSV